jgi:hypothetical protein
MARNDVSPQVAVMAEALMQGQRQCTVARASRCYIDGGRTSSKWGAFFPLKAVLQCDP